jgi:hypothetical protein
MKEPAPLAGPAQAVDDHSAHSATLLERQCLADFIAGCATFGWSVETVSHRVLKLTGRAGSVLLASSDPMTFPDTLRRIGDANAFAQRHRRP